MHDRRSKEKRGNGIWIAVTTAVLMMVTAWTFMLVLAGKNRPADVPLAHRMNAPSR